MMESVTYDAPRALEPSRAGTGQRDARFRAGQEKTVRHVVERRGRLSRRAEDRMGQAATLEPSSGTRAILPPTAPSFAGRGAARQALPAREKGSAGALLN